MSKAIIVLAAGKGSRMKTTLPKVLHPIMNQPIIFYLLDTVFSFISPEDQVIVVVGHKKDEVILEIGKKYPNNKIHYAVQEEQLGTGHALLCGLNLLKSLKPKPESVLILNGDIPLRSIAILEKLELKYREEGNFGAFVTHKTDHLSQAKGYGRVIRAKDKMVVSITEEIDCTEDELKIQHINAGIYLFNYGYLLSSVNKLSKKKKEYYLTDLIELGFGTLGELRWKSFEDFMGVNDLVDLVKVNDLIRRRILEKHLRNGVLIECLDSVSIDETVKIDNPLGIVIKANVNIRGNSVISDHVIIDVGSVIDNSHIGSSSHIQPYSIIKDSIVGKEVKIGPFAHLRPKSILEDKVHIGNFVELKKTVMEEGSKANHLAYLGDGVIGKNVNIGAGTIFCNFDGKEKHSTVIHEGAFIGSNCSLVAPIEIGSNSIIGAGTIVTKDIPHNSLAIVKQTYLIKNDYNKNRQSE